MEKGSHVDFKTLQKFKLSLSKAGHIGGGETRTIPCERCVSKSVQMRLGQWTAIEGDRLLIDFIDWFHNLFEIGFNPRLVKAL